MWPDPGLLAGRRYCRGRVGLVTAAAAIRRATAAGRAALVGYLPAGYPTVDQGIAACRVLAAAGVDVVEVGYPHSDPVRDGPVIARAHQAAIAAGVTAADVLRTVDAVASTDTPAMVMTYQQPIQRYGVAAFARDLAAAGGSGILVGDLTPDQADDWLAAADHHHLDHVLPVCPAADAAQLAAAISRCRGWTYAATSTGPTGNHTADGDQRARALVERIRELTPMPVAVGFGLDSPVRVAAVAQYADAVVVGTVLVQQLLDAPDLPTGLVGLCAVTRDLVAAVATRAT
jgi:tryptophan synthase alpha chain